QPAEETGGGANRLIKAGAFDKYPIEAVFGIHVNPFADEGIAVIRDEEITASATEYRFFLTGLSSHVADKEQAHSCGEALQHVLTQISQIQQFHLNGLKRNIVHIGHFKAGEAINTVPSNGYLEGTIRTYDIDDLTIVKNQMHKIAESVKLLFNVECEVKFAEGYPPTINSPKLRTQIEDALIKADLNVYDKPTPFLFGEDFSFYGQQLAPAYFVFIGTRNEDKGFVTGLHTSHLNFDEKALINVVNFYENLLNNYKEV
ncbi:TPA: M20/M25/M40 family metallo-hydrolase, partial [Staphylococcus aureus]